MADMTDRIAITTLVFGAFGAEALFCASRLNLADLIGDDDSAAAQLAERTDTDPRSMARLLRALAALELMTEPAPGVFRLTGRGALLRSDRPDSLRSFVTMFGDPAILAAWRELPTAIRTGERTFDSVFGKRFFEYLAENPELSKEFNTAMRQATTLTAQQLPDNYDFASFHTVADIGGGDGSLLAAVLSTHQHLRGIVFDIREGLAQAGATLDAVGVSDRCTVQPGDFFTSAPAGADLYLIKSVIHDWDDERADTILGHIRRAIPDGGRLLIIEPVLPPLVDGSQSPITYLSDLNMLVNLGGQERTQAEFEKLCARSGFTLTSVTPLPPPSGFCLLDAVPAPGG